MNSRLLQALSVRPFLFLWLAEVFSQIAMNMLNFVLIIVAFKLTESNTAVSGIILSFTIPAIIFGMLAGVFVDRWNKKNVLFWTNAIRTILLLILIFTHGNMPTIYLLSFAVAVVTQFFIPAETPMIPLLVKKDLLLSANALFGMALYGSVLVAYALSGPVLLLLGETYVFATLAFLFLVATFCVSLIKTPKSEEHLHGFLDNIQTNVVVGDIKNAFAVMTKTKDVYNSLFLLTLAQFIILILAVLGPGYGSEVLKINIEEFPILFVTPAAIGMVLGATMIGNYFQNRNRYKVAALGAFLAGIAVTLLPFGSREASASIVSVLNSIQSGVVVTNGYFVVLLAFVLGVANALVFVPSNTLLQEKTHEGHRGKIYGALNALTGIFSLVPVVIIGELADLYGVGNVLHYLGLTIAATGALHLFLSWRKTKRLWKQ